MQPASGYVTINDANAHLFINPVVGGEVKKCGTIPRNWRMRALGMVPGVPAFDLPIIPASDRTALLGQQLSDQARLSDVRDQGNAGAQVPSRDQNGVGYCWCHSGVSAHLLARAAMGMPYLDLSPFAIGCMVKNFRDEGGEGSEGVQFQSEKGCPTAQFWPQRSMSQSNDNPNTWANAALHKYLIWRDLDPQQMWDQLVTCAIMGWPVVSDFDWWSHSVCTANVVSDNPRKSTIWNSWGDTWSAAGMGDLEGSKAVPDSAIACIAVSVTMASTEFHREYFARLAERSSDMRERLTC